MQNVQRVLQPIILHQDQSGDTVLHQLALHHFPSLLDDLLATHSELAYIKNNHSHYPIHTAVLNNQLPNIQLLLAVNDGPMLADNHGWTALHYAARRSKPEILDYCCQITPNIDLLDNKGQSPLMLAAALGNLSAMIKLIEHGANVNIVDKYGLTVLHHAVESGNENVVGWLLENTTVDIHAKDYRNKTALQYTEHTRHDGIKGLLSEHHTMGNGI